MVVLKDRKSKPVLNFSQKQVIFKGLKWLVLMKLLNLLPKILVFNNKNISFTNLKNYFTIKNTQS